MRGNSVRVRRSLRTRVIAACALAFLGLAAVVCLVLPAAYEVAARTAFEERAATTARGLASLVRTSRSGTEKRVLDSLVSWLVSDPAVTGAAILDGKGGVLARWPESGPEFAGELPTAATVLSTASWFLGYHPLGELDPAGRTVVVRLSNAALIHDLENVRWLFSSIFLFTSVVFFVLTRYMTRTILQPIEEIRRAAMGLADGEPAVEIRETGDREIDELGEFITKLGDSRRHSRVMMNPLEILASRRWGRHGEKGPGGPDVGLSGPDAAARPPAEDPRS